VLRESSDGTVRISMRSKRFCDVAAVAQRFGGGGHQRAAGCTLEMPLDDALRTMRGALLDALQ
jgi:phosphoesterase RecJ-like protein